MSLDLDERVALTPEGAQALEEHRRLRLAALAWLRAIAGSDEYPMQISVRASQVRAALELGKPCGLDALRWLEREAHSGDAIKRRWALFALEQVRENDG